MRYARRYPEELPVLAGLLLRRADPGLLAYRIRRESSRSGSELSLPNLSP